jgi:hypothetical protein
MQHAPDPRRRGELTLDGKRVRVRLGGKDLEPTPAERTTTEAKPKPPMADDPRGAAARNVGGRYAT